MSDPETTKAARCLVLAALWLLALCADAATLEDFAARVADRTAVERVYAAHRTGATQPFEQILPLGRIEALVRDDAKKEAVLWRVYSVAITGEQIAAEVKRIGSTTRAPEILVEIKQALGDDPARFARTVVRPIIVERELRARFHNDDTIHAPQHRVAEQGREGALAARTDGMECQIAALKKMNAGMVSDTTWQLASRTIDRASALGAPPELPGTPTTARIGSTSYSIDATAQLAQTLSPPGAGGATPERAYFEDLPAELQSVLGAQLRRPGDVSAVIETDGTFLVFITRERSAETLSAGLLAVPKRSFEEWLAQQAEDKS